MENNNEFNINYEYICRYIRGALKQNFGLLKEMELYAQANNIPIADIETMRFVEVLLLGAKVKNVLEIGAAIGYSAITMAMCGAKVTTIEQNEPMLKVLKSNIEKASLSNEITVLKGDAAGMLPNLGGSFDFIFLDAAKGQYLYFLPDCIRLLKVGGILFSDNILYKGMVATDELVVRRKITIVRRLRQYLTRLCEDENLITSIIPIGDGAALSYLKSKPEQLIKETGENK